MKRLALLAAVLTLASAPLFAAACYYEVRKVNIDGKPGYQYLKICPDDKSTEVLCGWYEDGTRAEGVGTASDATCGATWFGLHLFGNPRPKPTGK